MPRKSGVQGSTACRLGPPTRRNSRGRSPAPLPGSSRRSSGPRRRPSSTPALKFSIFTYTARRSDSIPALAEPEAPVQPDRPRRSGEFLDLGVGNPRRVAPAAGGAGERVELGPQEERPKPQGGPDLGVLPSREGEAVVEKRLARPQGGVDPEPGGEGGVADGQGIEQNPLRRADGAKEPNLQLVPAPRSPADRGAWLERRRGDFEHVLGVDLRPGLGCVLVVDPDGLAQNQQRAVEVPRNGDRGGSGLPGPGPRAPIHGKAGRDGGRFDPGNGAKVKGGAVGRKVDLGEVRAERCLT